MKGPLTSLRFSSSTRDEAERLRKDFDIACVRVPRIDFLILRFDRAELSPLETGGGGDSVEKLLFLFQGEKSQTFHVRCSGWRQFTIFYWSRTVFKAYGTRGHNTRTVLSPFQSGIFWKSNKARVTPRLVSSLGFDSTLWRVTRPLHGANSKPPVG